MTCGGVAGLARGEAAGGRDPARVAAHHLQDEDRVEVRAMEATSSAASSVETATYFATEPKPGQQSVIGRSLSTVFGMPMQVTG